MPPEKQRPDIVVQITKSFKGINLTRAKLEKTVKAVCNRFKLHKATITIAVVDNAEIRKINSRFLNRNCITDVISFDLSNDTDSAKSFDLVVNGEKAVKEAKKRGHSPEAELALYITHGLLHNLGFDDSTQRQAKKMHDIEDEILQQLGYGLVYNS